MITTSAWRSDFDRVTGKIPYTADVPCPHALHAAFVLSPERHAKIVSIDTSEAEALEGVEAVLTGKELGELYIGRSLRDLPVLAVDRVLFVGQRVAAVAAVDAETARRAAELVVVEYQPLDALLTLEDAFNRSEPVLHPKLQTYEGIDEDHPDGNLQGGTAIASGDVEQGFEEADRLYEHVFRWDRSHSAPLETHGCLVVAGDDQTVVYASHKEPYNLRRDLARLSGRPLEHFVIAPANIGGDFGAKGAPLVEAACFFLSERTGRPVRTMMTYLEELTTTSARHPGYLRMRTGLKDERLHANEIEAVLDGGAFAALKSHPNRAVWILGLALHPYHVPNFDERLVVAYTNTLPGGHVRGPGEFQAVFCGESHLDMIARERDIDPIEFRLANVKFPQTKRILRQLEGVVETWRSESQGRTGIGIAVFDRAGGMGRTRVELMATVDGVVLRTPVPDQGSGMYQTFQRMAATMLNVDIGDIAIEPVGADPKLTDSGTGASRVTAVAGQACRDACSQLLERLEVDAPQEESGFWIADRLREIHQKSIELTAEVSTKEKSPAMFGGLAIELTVDSKTGQVGVERAELFIDGGEIFNPVGFRGQVEGGFIYGLSQTLFEQLITEDGQIVTASLGDYKLACVGDIPPLEVHLLPPLKEDSDPDAIRGGAGELTNLGVGAAVANAIDDAVGVRIQQLPITAEVVWRALRGKQ